MNWIASMSDRRRITICVLALITVLVLWTQYGPHPTGDGIKNESGITTTTTKGTP